MRAGINVRLLLTGFNSPCSSVCEISYVSNSEYGILCRSLSPSKCIVLKLNANIPTERAHWTLPTYFRKHIFINIFADNSVYSPFSSRTWNTAVSTTLHTHTSHGLFISISSCSSFVLSALVNRAYRSYFTHSLASAPINILCVVFHMSATTVKLITA